MLLWFVTGCRNDIRSPVGPAGGNNNGGNNGGGNNGGGNYGALIFASGSSTLWETDGPITVSSGSLIAQNPSSTPGDTALGAAWLIEPIDIGDAINVIFTWKDGVTEGGSYKFFIGEPPDRWTGAPYHLEGQDLNVAPVRIYLSAPMQCRFEFILPPSSRVRLYEIRAYGS